MMNRKRLMRRQLKLQLHKKKTSNSWRILKRQKSPDGKPKKTQRKRQKCKLKHSRNRTCVLRRIVLFSRSGIRKHASASALKGGVLEGISLMRPAAPVWPLSLSVPAPRNAPYSRVGIKIRVSAAALKSNAPRASFSTVNHANVANPKQSAKATLTAAFSNLSTKKPANARVNLCSALLGMYTMRKHVPVLETSSVSRVRRNARRSSGTLRSVSVWRSVRLIRSAG